MKAELKQHLETVGSPSIRVIEREAKTAAWNAAVNIEDYMGWCEAGYQQKLNIYGEPYKTADQIDQELTIQLTELYEAAVSINGLRVVRFNKPDLNHSLRPQDFTGNPKAKSAYIKEFYKMMEVWHHQPMKKQGISNMLSALPPQIELISYLAPDGLRTNVSSEGFICEGQDPVPSRLRPFGQRGAGRVEQPHKSYSYSADMVTRVSKQLVHLITNRDKFYFDIADGAGYIPDRPLFDDSPIEELSRIAWDGWDNQIWFDQ